MERKVLIAAVLLVMLSTAPFIAAASASAHQNSVGITQSPETEHERNVSVQQHSSNETEIDSEYLDHMAIHFTTEEGISLKLEYNSHAGNTSAEFQLHVRFVSLVELVGNNTVSTIDLTKVQYSSPQVSNFTSSGGVKGYRIESHAVNTTYTFQVVAYINENITIVNGTSLSPTQMKINIVIENFPYTQTGSSLGLVVDSSSQVEIHNAHDMNGADDVEVNTNVVRGYFSWSSTALVDNVAKPVTSTTSTEAEDHLITLVYPHGTKIVHDPILGVGPVPATGLFSSAALYIAFGAAILAVALVFAIRRTRPRIQNSAR